MNTAILVGFYAMFHLAAHKLMDNTEQGKKFKNFLVTWRTDSFLYLLLCSMTVFVWTCCSIVLLALVLSPHMRTVFGF